MPAHKLPIDKDIIEELYYSEKMSTSDIGDSLGCNGVTILNRMKEFDLSPRSVPDALSIVHHDRQWCDRISDSLLGHDVSRHTRELIGEVRSRKLATGESVLWNKGKRKATHPELKNTGNPGERHWNWKGGISSESARIRQSSEYKAWRDGVFRRDDWTCQECNGRGGSLVAHHIESFAENPDLRFVVSNGITLCSKCHDEIHSGGNNGKQFCQNA